GVGGPGSRVRKPQRQDRVEEEALEPVGTITDGPQSRDGLVPVAERDGGGVFQEPIRPRLAELVLGPGAVALLEAIRGGRVVVIQGRGRLDVRGPGKPVGGSTPGWVGRAAATVSTRQFREKLARSTLPKWVRAQSAGSHSWSDKSVSTARFLKKMRGSAWRPC